MVIRTPLGIKYPSIIHPPGGEKASLVKEDTLSTRTLMMASRYGRESMPAEEGEDEARVDKVASSAWSFDCMFWW